MGTTHATVTLRNATDVANAESGYIKEKDIRELTVPALVDTGALLMALPEWVYHRLGLHTDGLRNAIFADRSEAPCKLTSGMKVLWEDRDAECRALVVPGINEVLLGALALEELDLMVNPVDQKLVGAHGDTQKAGCGPFWFEKVPGKGNGKGE
jgi:clan AA aspartic protease